MSTICTPMRRLITCLILCHWVALAWVPSSDKWGRVSDLERGHDRGTRQTSRVQRGGRLVLPPCGSATTDRISRSSLSMGLMDSISNFLHTRSGDFVKLQESEERFGPGPILLLYNIPPGIDDEELVEMVSDGAPSLQKGRDGCVVCRLSDQSPELDLPMQEALETLAKFEESRLPGQSASILDRSSIQSSSNPLASAPEKYSVPVLLFSGFVNSEMLQVYNIIGKEVYDETGGLASPACAKAVPNAMTKPLRQVLSEVSGDHQDAMRLDRQD